MRLSSKLALGGDDDYSFRAPCLHRVGALPASGHAGFPQSGGGHIGPSNGEIVGIIAGVAAGSPSWASSFITKPQACLDHRVRRLRRGGLDPAK